MTHERREIEPKNARKDPNLSDLGKLLLLIPEGVVYPIARERSGLHQVTREFGGILALRVIMRCLDEGNLEGVRNCLGQMVGIEAKEIYDMTLRVAESVFRQIQLEEDQGRKDELFKCLNSAIAILPKQFPNKKEVLVEMWRINNLGSEIVPFCAQEAEAGRHERYYTDSQSYAQALVHITLMRMSREYAAEVNRNTRIDTLVTEGRKRKTIPLSILDWSVEVGVGELESRNIDWAINGKNTLSPEKIRKSELRARRRITKPRGPGTIDVGDVTDEVTAF